MSGSRQGMIVAALGGAVLGAIGTLAVQRIVRDEPSREAVETEPIDTGRKLRERDGEIARLRAQLGERSRQRTSAPDADSSAAQTSADTSGSPGSATKAPPEPNSSASAPTMPESRTPPRQVAPTPQAVVPSAASSQLDRVKADILQIADATQRETGLVAFGEMLRSSDAATARAALASLYQLRDVTYDKSRFRNDVLQRLQDSDAGVRSAAGYALLQVDRDAADLDRVLTIAEKDEVPSPALLQVATTLNKNRVEGRLEALFVKALAIDDPIRGATDTANCLRGVWVSPAAEDAVVAASQRRPAGSDSGRWPYILGQMQPPPRESRVRAIFTMIASGDEHARQLAGVAIERPVDEAARPIAAQLAAAGLASAPTAALRRTYLQSIQSNGGREQAPTVRALADNALIGEDLRALAAKIADELERRR